MNIRVSFPLIQSQQQPAQQAAPGGQPQPSQGQQPVVASASPLVYQQLASGQIQMYQLPPGFVPVLVSNTGSLQPLVSIPPQSQQPAPVPAASAAAATSAIMDTLSVQDPNNGARRSSNTAVEQQQMVLVPQTEYIMMQPPAPPQPQMIPQAQPQQQMQSPYPHDQQQMQIPYPQDQQVMMMPQHQMAMDIQAQVPQELPPPLQQQQQQHAAVAELMPQVQPQMEQQVYANVANEMIANMAPTAMIETSQQQQQYLNSVVTSRPTLPTESYYQAPMPVDAPVEIQPIMTTSVVESVIETLEPQFEAASAAAVAVAAPYSVSPQPNLPQGPDPVMEAEAELPIEDDSTLSTQGKDVSHGCDMMKPPKILSVVSSNSLYSSTSSLSSSFSCDHLMHYHYHSNPHATLQPPPNSVKLQHQQSLEEYQLQHKEAAAQFRKSSVPTNDIQFHAEALLRRGSLPPSILLMNRQQQQQTSDTCSDRLQSRRSSSGAIIVPLATLRENQQDSDISLEDLSQVKFFIIFGAEETNRGS